jgi:hypothetical protein
MKKLLGCVTLGSTLGLLASGQAIVQQTNCPKVLSPGTIVAAQAVSSLANYPVIILACYTLNASNFSIDNTTTPPTIDVIGGAAGNPGGSAGQFQVNVGDVTFGGVTFSGDAAVASNGVLTLATVNGNPLTCGDTTHSCTLTINGKGQVTAASNNTIAGGGGGTLTISLSGTTVGAQPILDFENGTGVVQSILNTGTKIQNQIGLNTAIVPTFTQLQTNKLNYYASSSNSGTTYTACTLPVVNSLTTGMVVSWVPDVNGTGGATTLSICTLGTPSLKLSDGTTDPSSNSIVAGHLYQLWYDGTVWRFVS